MTFHVRGEYDFRRLGIAAAARRYNAGAAEAARAGEASWFSSYSRRKAYVLEVNRRMDALWQDIYQSHAADATFRQEFDRFMKDWQSFVSGLSIAGMMLPSTEEYANRVNEQIEQWRSRFVLLGGKPTIPDFMPNEPPAAPPFPWGKLFVAVAIVGVVAGVVFVGSKIPTAAHA